MGLNLTSLNLLLLRRTRALSLCLQLLQTHGAGSAPGEASKDLVACMCSKSNIHCCLLLGYVLCCCPAHSALLDSSWVAASWKTLAVVFVCPWEKPFCVQGCCLHKWSMQSVCRYVMQDSAVVWWAQPHARSLEEGDRLGVDKEG